MDDVDNDWVIEADQRDGVINEYLNQQSALTLTRIA